MMEKESKSFIIYKVENVFSEEVYIGATTKSIEGRKQDHLKLANRNKTGKLYEAIATCNIDDFSWEQIDTASSSDELALKEKEYVIKYNSKNEGYNSDSGGGFKKTVYQYSLEDGSLISTFNCLQNASDVVNATKQSISSACLSVNKVYDGFYWSYEYKEPFKSNKDARKKKVLYYNLKEDLVKEFDSVIAASKETKINKNSIAKYCRGERKSPNGCSWEYKIKG